MGAEEQIVLDRIEQNIRELNRTMREFMRLYEERTRETVVVKREKRERGQGHGRTQ
jgi:ketosteroid isomerase-like protein